jgi:hypothetical protein
MKEISVIWLVPLLAWAAAVIALYASRPQHRKLAHLSVFLMACLAAWQAYVSYGQWRTQQLVEKYAYSRLESATRNMLHLTHQIVIQASDGWLPSTDEEFFSEHTASLICRYLNIEKRAPVAPDRSWLVWIHQQTKEAQDEISTVLDSYAPALDDQLLQSAIDFKKSFMFTFPALRIAIRKNDAQKGHQRPPLLCHGLEAQMQKSLSEMRRLYEVLWKRTGSKRFSLTDRKSQMALIGSARFTDEDLKRWTIEHPYAPSGKP